MFETNEPSWVRKFYMAERRRPFTTKPQITGVPFGTRTRSSAVPLLTAADKAALTKIGTLIEVPKCGVVYRSSAPAVHVYNLVEGVLRTFQVLPGRRTHISALTPEALSGELDKFASMEKVCQERAKQSEKLAGDIKDLDGQ